MAPSRRAETGATAPPPPSQRGFFNAAVSGFEEAERRTGGRAHLVSVGGLPVRLRFAGQPLERAIMPALAHALAHGPANSSVTPLEVVAWDTASSGVSMPPPAWSIEDYDQRGEIRRYDADQCRASFGVEGALLSLFSAERNMAVYWVRDAAAIPYYERGAPLRSIFNWWLVGHHRQSVHAAAVGTPAGCILLAGKGGSGKSNLALASLSTPLSYLADDYCVIDPADAPVVYSLYNTGKADAGDLPRLGLDRSRASNVDRLDSEKALFFLHDWRPDKVLREAPLRAVVLPHVGADLATGLRRASPVEALMALAPSTTSQLPHAGGEVLRSLSAVVRAARCYHLDIRAGDRQAVHALVELLNS
jgi:hypothetical protein